MIDSGYLGSYSGDYSEIEARQGRGYWWTGARICEGDADGGIGAAPPSLCPPTGEPGAAKIAKHFNVQKPTVLEGEIKADMPLTLFRLSSANYHFLKSPQTVYCP